MKNLFEKFISKKANKTDEEKVEIGKLNEDQVDKVNKLDKTVDLLFANKQELRSVYQEIKDYLPENKKNIPAEAIWEVLSQKKDETGIIVELSEEEIINSVAQRANDVINEKIEELKINNPDLSEEYLDKEYQRLMKKTYVDFFKFKDLAGNIKDRDNYYQRINQYKEAKTEEEKSKIWEDIPEEIKEISKYKNFVLREFVEAKKNSENLKNNIEASKQIIYRLKSEGARADEIKLAYQELRDDLKEYEQLILSSPELYYYESSQRLKEAKQVIDNKGSIIETPYVKGKLSLIDSFNNRPVFIHGELGSGKTELAKHACVKKYSEKYLKNVWEKDNPKPSDEKDLIDWQEARKKAAQPLLISGHKNIDIGDFFGSKEMKTKEALPAEELANLIENTIQRVKSQRQAENKDISKEEEKDIRDIMKENLKNPVEVKTIIGNFYKAMQEGRPIILDEINAIPHTALIALNDLLTLKPGDTVNPLMPGIKKFKVADGFKVFATGNWKPEDGKAYFGRQGLDAAFLSRFAIIHYDYLPQRIIGNSETSDSESSQKEHAENELSLIMIASLLDENLSLKLPKNSLKKISALASVSRLIQNIFSEKEEGEVEFDWRSAGKKLKQKDVLKENVLSIRHLIPIIKNWKNDGFKHELEEYILKDYIERSSNSRNSEKILLYRLMQNIHGGVLFDEKNNWPSSAGVEGEKKVLELSADKRLFSHHSITGEISSDKIVDDSIEEEFLSTKELIESLFGKFPERKFVSKRLFEEKNKEKLDQNIERELESINGGLNDLLINLEKQFETDEHDEEVIKKIKKTIDI
jgi:MoxR-like ATPase